MKPDLPFPVDEPADDDERRWLSALADGDVDAADPACRLWRDDEGARQTWHAYHLIGDVMRSEELATRPEHDRDFMAALSQRLAAEPVVLAPAAAPPVVPRRWPAAMAAGFAVVAGVLVVLRTASPDPAPGAAQVAAASSAARSALVSAQAGDRPGVGRETMLITDPRLDEFLRAHQAAGGGVAMAAPGGTLRRVEAVVPVSLAR